VRLKALLLKPVSGSIQISIPFGAIKRIKTEKDGEIDA